ncbi:MAG: tRNA-specific adenosine deaminase, partial [bacterium]
IIFGARDEKFGGCGSIFNIVSDKRLNHQIEITAGVMEKDAASLMKSFFRKRRKKGSKGKLG